MWRLTIALLVVSTAVHAGLEDDDDSSSSSSSDMCYTVRDCEPVPECYTAECYYDMSGGGKVSVANGQHRPTSGTCRYERKSVDECCLTSDECCAFAADFQVGICDKNCTCQFTSSLMCVDDESCDSLLSAKLCRQQGECFHPYCERGLCECFDGNGADLDGDGVTCPDDCNDHDASVSKQLTCVRDADNDHYPDCDCEKDRRSDDDDDDHSWTWTSSSSSSSSAHSWTWTSSSSSDDDNHHGGGGGGGGHGRGGRRGRRSPCCMRFCVEPEATCPMGWTDPCDPYRFKKQQSYKNQSSSCTYDDVIIPEDQCDCCDIDSRAYPGSLYVSNTPNHCHDADYNCDGEATGYACCSTGRVDTAHQIVGGGGGERTLWYTNECHQVDDRTCGGCSSPEHGGEFDLDEGWACSESCSEYYDEIFSSSSSSSSDDDNDYLVQRKRSLGGKSGDDDDDSGGDGDPTCPDSCNGECVCVDKHNEPLLGQCAKYIVDCEEVRHDVYSDVEECCAVAIQ